MTTKELKAAIAMGGSQQHIDALRKELNERWPGAAKARAKRDAAKAAQVAYDRWNAAAQAKWDLNHQRSHVRGGE